MPRDIAALNVLLISEFNQYVFEHPDVLEKIPSGAIVVLQLEGDEEYNAWSRRMAEAGREPDRPVAYFCIRKLAPARSRILEGEVLTV
jgi:hypothetical protein